MGRFSADIGRVSRFEEPWCMELINKSLLESIAKDMYMYTIPQPREITS